MVESCPFCRKALPETKKEVDKLKMKRIEANDPAALFHEGVEQAQKRNTPKHLSNWEMLMRTINLACCIGRDLVEKDKKKVVYHLEEAAICGHPAARWKLGFIEEKNGNSERSVKHGNDKDGCIQERICQQR